jgi:hypothetical protein
VGHPIAIHVGHENCTGFEKMNGVIKCKVLAPGSLYHPVLPYRLHNRLFFALCSTCAEELNQKNAIILMLKTEHL